jgi:hypothetical protein
MRERTRYHTWRWHHRLIKEERAPLPNEQRAKGDLQACGPRPIAWQHPRQAVMRDGFQGFCQGHAAARCAIIEQCGEVEPKQLWYPVSSFVTVGWALYAISPPLRNL